MKVYISIAVLTVSLFVISCNSKPDISKEKLVGEWAFSTFEPFKKMSPANKRILEAANNDNKNTVLKFGADNHFFSSQYPENINERFSLIPATQQIVMAGDTLEILTLDAEWLRLFKNKKSPVAVFRKKN